LSTQRVGEKPFVKLLNETRREGAWHRTTNQGVISRRTRETACGLREGKKKRKLGQKKGENKAMKNRGEFVGLNDERGSRTRERVILATKNYVEEGSWIRDVEERRRGREGGTRWRDGEEEGQGTLNVWGRTLPG